MPATRPKRLWTRRDLAAHLSDLGLAAGDAVLVHAGLRAIGPILGGADMLIVALRDAVGRDGTILAYTDWLWADDWATDPDLRPHAPAFDPAASRAARDNGAFAELLRTTPGARRSASPGASCAALGAQADWFLADHALDYGYGERSPFARLVSAGGRTLMIGAPHDTMTLLHHAEHLADIPGKRVKRYEAPLLVDGETVWRRFEEFDTALPVVEGLPEDYFGHVVAAFLAAGFGRQGLVGAAPALLVDAAAITRFAVDWLERSVAVTPAPSPTSSSSGTGSSRAGRGT